MHAQTPPGRVSGRRSWPVKSGRGKSGTGLRGCSTFGIRPMRNYHPNKHLTRTSLEQASRKGKGPDFASRACLEHVGARCGSAPGVHDPGTWSSKLLLWLKAGSQGFDFEGLETSRTKAAGRGRCRDLPGERPRSSGFSAPGPHPDTLAPNLTCKSKPGRINVGNIGTDKLTCKNSLI